MRPLAHARLRWPAATLAAALIASLFVGASVPASAAENPSDIASYAPAGTVNVATGATATAHSAETAWPPAKLIDGHPGTPGLNLWVAGETGVDAGGWVDLALAQPEPVERIVVFPRGDGPYYGWYFPIEYTVSLLDELGGVVWSETRSHTDAFDAVVTEPDVIDLPVATEASRVRLDVTKRQSREGGVLQLGEIAVFAAGESTPPPTGEGTNLALNARISASTSYEKADESWSIGFLNDGDTSTLRGWSTNPYDRTQDPGADVTITLQLACVSDVSEVIVHPRTKSFPKDYRIEVSSDGDTWESVAESLGNPSEQSTPQAFPIEGGATASQVRLVVDTRNGPAGVDGYLVQLAEVSVFGEAGACMSLVKPALLLEPGAVERNWFAAAGIEAPYEVSSSDEAVATVDGEGAITAVGVGTATVTLGTGAQAISVPVEVSDDVERIGDDLAITVFWPPLPEYVNDEQYDYLAEAGIDLVQASQLTASPEINLEMARLAHERGMQTIVQDETANPATMTSDEAAAWAERYTNVPGVGGFYLVDEPVDATVYAPAFNAIREVAPEYYSHLNFFPYHFYGSEEGNDAAMQAWLDATAPHGIDEPDYLMYDLYPFGVNGGFNGAGMFTNLNTVRELGLENEIKTGLYLQSVGIPGAYRRPSPDEIRYEANLALAYGYKQLSYFTWWTPTNRSEPFTDAIMTADGQKTDLYEPVKQLNSEIHALGPTLMGLDAQDVYLSGETFGQEAVPADFIVQSEDDTDLVLSRMVDRETGDEYLFVVNNSFTEAQDVTLRFDESVKAVQEVSRVDGTLGAAVPIAEPDASGADVAALSLTADAEAGVLAGELEVSEGVLYRLLDTYDGGEEPGGEEPGGEEPGGEQPGGEQPGGGTGGSGTGTASTAGTGDHLASTGATVPWALTGAAAIMLALGAILIGRRRLRGKRAG